MTQKRLLVILLTLAITLTNVVPSLGAWRFAIDNQNSRRILDSGANYQLPFAELWATQLGGKVESQPIIANGFIYVQAGKYLVKLSLDGKIAGKTPYIVNNHDIPSGSSPTYAVTKFGPRIYQATRDHRLWAIDPNTLEPLWNYGASGNALILSVGGKPDKRYRVTSSPLVITPSQQNPIISVGTGNGDLTSLSGQYADNGFFIIEDQGNQGKVLHLTKMDGEVTGSPILQNNTIIATENRWMADSAILRYSLKVGSEIKPGYADHGIPGSPAGEGNYVYVADQLGYLYKLQNINDFSITKRWVNPKGPSDIDYYRTASSKCLSTPTIGDKFIFLPIRHYKSLKTAGPGALIAVDKSTGNTAWVMNRDNAKKKFKVSNFLTSPITANSLYWKPGKTTGGYIFVFEANGNAWCLDEATGRPLPWVYNKDTKKVDLTAKLTGISGQIENTSEILIDNGLLLIVDGQGVMHAYKAAKSINFKAISLKEPGGAQYDVGDTIPFQFTVQNTSDKDYANIPVTLTNNGATVQEQYISLPKNSPPQTIAFNYKVTNSTSPNFTAVINPPGDSKEIKEESFKDDNYASASVKMVSRDLSVKSLTGPETISPKAKGKINAVLYNDSKVDTNNVLVRWQQDGKTIHEQRVNLPASKNVPVSLAWTSPGTPSLVHIAVTVDPNAEVYDTNRSNNTRSIYLDVISNETHDCGNQLSDGSWSVSYRVLVGYDKDHNPIYEDHSVSYSESLVGTLDVNTKQGIPTDPNNPKPTDRESRGSWEIIPWAQQNGLDPNHVTRAGYGFEVKVTTSYDTDWESKVPSGANKIGGSYNGPDKVWVEFYDTRGKYVGKANLERTSGTSGKGTAVWQLPEQRYKFSDGQVVYERKHYTSPDIPDGQYQVLVHIENAGRNNLYICKTMNVTIRGSMYDDQYTAPVIK